MAEQHVCRWPGCGRAIVYRKRKFSWVHVTKLSAGEDHPPIP